MFDVQELKGGYNMNLLNGISSKDDGTFGNNDITLAPKPRKPYTITKKRERWTEEEHKKFLEAIQLYGRAWRRIEEHIGTKTSVQSRSHAQKFFSKVTREADGNVEIPPPRPKRKPNHPYPRKEIHPCVAETRVLAGAMDSPSLPVSPIFEDENRSPTSVLPSPLPKNSGALYSNKPTSCSSLIAPAAGSNQQGNRMQSPVASDKEDDNPISQSDRTTTQCRSVMNRESGSSFVDYNKSSVPTLKLFGRTVIVAESGKHAPARADFESNTVENRREGFLDLDAGSSARSAQNEPAGGLFPIFYCFPSFEDAARSSANAGMIPVPRWDFYQNLTFPVGNYREDLDPFRVPIECSRSGSITLCDCGEKKLKPVDQDDSAFRRNQNAAADNKSARGFLPYRRNGGTESRTTQLP